MCVEFAVFRQQTCIVAAWLSLSVWAPPADAEGVSGPEQASSSEASLSLELSGRIAPRCTMSLDDTRLHVLMEGRTGSASVGASVDCNDTMRVDFRSRNGALVHSDADNLMSSPGFTARVPYSMTLDVAAPDAVPVTVSSEDATAETGGSIGVVPYSSRAKLRVDWRAEEEPFGGTYGDVIEIRVSIAGDTGGRVQ